MTWRWALLASFVLAGCAPAGVPEAADDPSPSIFWPSLPEPARIEFVRSVRTPQDLGVRSSFFSGIMNALAGTETRFLVRPYAIAVDDSHLVVGDTGADAVHLFDLDRKRYRKLDTVGGDKLRSPVGVALGPDRIFVADSSLQKVYILDRSGELIRAIDGMQRPTGIVFDSKGRRLFVADTLQHQVQVFDPEGVPRYHIGQRGEGPGSLNFPTHISLDEAGLLVNDSMNFRIQKFSREGQPVGHFGSQGDSSGFLSHPKGIAVDSDGNVYVAGATIDRIQIFSAEGDFLLGFGGSGNGYGQFTMPAGVAIHRDLIYVADSYNGRIQIFRYLPNEPVH